MTTEGHNSIAVDELRLLVERIERLTQQIKDAQEDVRGIYAEAKSDGFDTKAMRQIVKLRAMDPHKRVEEEMMLDTYRAALGMN